MDLSTAEGADILARLAASSDVFLTNKPPFVRRKLKIELTDLRRANPNIIYVAGTAYGPRGPLANHGGYDSTAFWCRAGIGSVFVGPDNRPLLPGPAFGDSIGGMTIAGGVTAALLHRERTGEAPSVEVSLLGTGIWAMGPTISVTDRTKEPWALNRHRDQPSRNPMTGPYATKDHRWIMLGMLQGFAYWPDTADALGHPEWVDDPRFVTPGDFATNADSAAKMIATVIASQPLNHWVEQLRGFRGQWAPLNDSIEVVSDPQVEANGYLAHLESADGTPYVLATAPVEFDGAPCPPGRAPAFNEHGDDILSSIGCSRDEIIDLKVKGVVA
jgi:crotonobetainyl-CoA:carnitine CoA-transferase CaiB-like acyl-CoA transferase